MITCMVKNIVKLIRRAERLSQNGLFSYRRTMKKLQWVGINGAAAKAPLLRALLCQELPTDKGEVHSC